MEHNTDFQHAPSNDVEVAIGRRLNAIRLDRNYTQKELAEIAGVSRGTIARLGKESAGISLDSLIRIMQALGLSDALQHMLPQSTISPLAQLEAQEKESVQTRQRASGKRAADTKWTWEEGDSS